MDRVLSSVPLAPPMPRASAKFYALVGDDGRLDNSNDYGLLVIDDLDKLKSFMPGGRYVQVLIAYDPLPPIVRVAKKSGKRTHFQKIQDARRKANPHA